METALESVNEFPRPQQMQASTSGAMVEASRAVQEAQAQIVAAKHFPRDQFTALNEILQDCERFGLADQALYSYPRGGKHVTGPSIRLAEAMAQRWGNIDYGIKEVEQQDGESHMVAYCWDLEKNTRVTKHFTVKHERTANKKRYKLEDSRDVYELTANMGARRVRACILGVIPGDVTEKAVKQVKATIARGDGTRSHKQILQDLVIAFDKLGVPKVALEQKLGHPIEATIADELADLKAIYNSVKENPSSRMQFFKIAGPTDKTRALNEKIVDGEQ